MNKDCNLKWPLCTLSSHAAVFNLKDNCLTDLRETGRELTTRDNTEWLAAVQALDYNHPCLASILLSSFVVHHFYFRRRLQDTVKKIINVDMYFDKYCGSHLVEMITTILLALEKNLRSKSNDVTFVGVCAKQICFLTRFVSQDVPAALH